MKKLGIYIHIPFCEKKCNYCDFYSFKTDDDSKKKYIKCLTEHISKESEMYKEYTVDTVFIGGGTPSVIHPDDMEKLVEVLKNSFDFSGKTEFTIEANPDTISSDMMKKYLSLGINRISFGLQSTNDEELKTLGRIHTYKDFLNTYTLARETGFKNINIDIMYALPHQRIDSLRSTLSDVLKLSPEHISAYCLKIEKGTPFYEQKDVLDLPSDDMQYEMYLEICTQLAKNKYHQYEISNFALDGFECAHNLKYWNSEEYLGFGPSSHSFIDGKRFFYPDSVMEYESQIEKGNLPKKEYEETHILTEKEKMDEYVMLKMRLSSGIDILDFRQKFNRDFDETYPKTKEYIKTEHIKKDFNKYSFTPKGFFVSNYILSDILF